MKVDKKQMKSAARLYAVQALFQMESSGQTVESVTKEFETHRFGAIYDEEEMADGNVDHFRAVVDHAVNLQAKIDQMTDRALVAISEYVDVAKAFFPDGKESKFVNAVLDHMAHELTPEGF